MMASPRLRSSMGDSSVADAAPIEGSPIGCAQAAIGRAGMAKATDRPTIAPRFAIEQMDGIFLRFISL
ncbi:hypothetical protein GCM10008164_42860 [Achromobacter xylosoxidans]|nr:hypothetical protein GCM10008164_42860 [Achromobacter xylosoxidans]